jgi:hypothetical protein
MEDNDLFLLNALSKANRESAREAKTGGHSTACCMTTGGTNGGQTEFVAGYQRRRPDVQMTDVCRYFVEQFLPQVDSSDEKFKEHMTASC